MEQIKELGNIIQQQKPEVFKELAQADSKKGMLFTRHYGRTCSFR
jgi:hypothetical protein